ncbi:MAG: TolC family protein [Deltaproteobacteria bacterium]|nr:TolC family protein [Deltaproteobacteria bacterium]
MGVNRGTTGVMAVALLAATAALGDDVVAPPASTTRLRRLEAIQLGVGRNAGLLTERIERQRSLVLSRAAWQRWSPVLFVESGYRKGHLQPEDRLSTSIGASWEAIVGTRVEAAVGVDQGLGGPSGSAAHEPSVVVRVDQPLLKGGWLPGASLPLTEAALVTRIQDELYRDAVNAFVVDVDAAYWDLGVAESDLEIKTRSTARAQAQFQDTQENIRRGILADAEIYVVEENLVIFQAEHLRAEQGLRAARQKLAQLLYLDVDAPLASAETLDLSGLPLPDRDRAIEAALASNPRVLAQRLRVNLAQQRVRFSTNQSLPALALTSSVGLFGSSRDYGGAWEGLAFAPGVDAQVGLRLDVPLDRIAVDSALDAAVLEEKRETAELHRQENAVRFEVQNAIASLLTDLALARSAARQVTLAELKLQAQNDKYRSGLSTLADVVRFQRDLDGALIAAKRVVRAVRVGETRVLASVGTLHDSVGVSMAPPAAAP